MIPGDLYRNISLQTRINEAGKITGACCSNADVLDFSNAELVEVYIPALPKDLEILPYVVDSIRKNLKHQVSAIHIVAPQNVGIQNLCTHKSLLFVDEASLLSIQKKDIEYRVGELDRSGWLFQQLLKFACIKRAKTNWVFIADADTVLLRPQSFFNADYLIFDVPLENHLPYKNAVESLLGQAALPNISFVAHHIMVQRDITVQLLAAIEARSGKGWIESICALISSTEPSCFSEYDLLGNYFVLRDPKKVRLRNWMNGSYIRSRLWMLKLPGISAFYRTLSFHSYHA